MSFNAKFFNFNYYLVSVLKALERQESILQANYDGNRSQLLAEVDELEDKLAAAWNIETLTEDIDRLLSESLEKLNSVKKVRWDITL